MPDGAATFSAVVCGVTDLTHDVRIITLRLDAASRLTFLPGQFVSFSIERPTERHATTRAYSIVSSPDIARDIELLLNLVPGGPGSEYLFGLREGDQTRFRGPFGTFVVKPGATTDLLLVANDTGIAPFMSMLRWLAAHEPQRGVALVWGLPSESHLYYQDELTALGARMPNLSTRIVLSAPEGDWTGLRGRVQEVVESTTVSVANLEAFLCGNTAMIRDVRDLLRAKGPCPIYREPYYNDVKRDAASGGAA